LSLIEFIKEYLKYWEMVYWNLLVEVADKIGPFFVLFWLFYEAVKYYIRKRKHKGLRESGRATQNKKRFWYLLLLLFLVTVCGLLFGFDVVGSVLKIIVLFLGPLYIIQEFYLYFKFRTQ